jgi:hypothetical protein
MPQMSVRCSRASSASTSTSSSIVNTAPSAVTRAKEVGDPLMTLRYASAPLLLLHAGQCRQSPSSWKPTQQRRSAFRLRDQHRLAGLQLCDAILEGVELLLQLLDRQALLGLKGQQAVNRTNDRQLGSDRHWGLSEPADVSRAHSLQNAVDSRLGLVKALLEPLEQAFLGG